MESYVNYVDVTISYAKDPMASFGKCSFLPCVDVFLINNKNK